MISENVKNIIQQNVNLLNSNLNGFLDYAFEMLYMEEFEELMLMLKSINAIKKYGKEWNDER